MGSALLGTWAPWPWPTCGGYLKLSKICFSEWWSLEWKIIALPLTFSIVSRGLQLPYWKRSRHFLQIDNRSLISPIFSPLRLSPISMHWALHGFDRETDEVPLSVPLRSGSTSYMFCHTFRHSYHCFSYAPICSKVWLRPRWHGNCLVGRTADGGVIWVDIISVLPRENASSSHRKCVLYTDVCLLRAESMSTIQSI